MPISFTKDRNFRYGNYCIRMDFLPPKRPEIKRFCRHSPRVKAADYGLRQLTIIAANEDERGRGAKNNS